MRAVVFGPLSLLVWLGMMIAQVQAAPPGPGEPVFAKFIGGTVETIDHAGLKITILTDMGKLQSLPIDSPDVIKGLAKGDRVSVELDEQGNVMKIVKTGAEQKTAPEPRG